VDTRGRLNLSTIHPFLKAARHNRILVIYDLFHFGYPADLDPLSMEFQKRFAEYCYQVAKFVNRHSDGPCFFTPVNEPSYFAWAGGEAGLFAPYLKGRGKDLKMALVSAAIQGINAIWAACPSARIVNVDPYCRVVPSSNDPELQRRCDEFNTVSVFESWDMLAGIRLPELGGSRRHLGTLGVNYYWTNQWILDRCDISLAENDPRRISVSEILKIFWDRYSTDILITETSHVGERRVEWLRELATELDVALNMHIPIGGVCWYPVLEMPEWHVDQWTQMGLWNLDQTRAFARVPHQPVLRELLKLEERFASRQDKVLSCVSW